MTHQEKLEEMRKDWIEEQKLRKDYDYFIDHIKSDIQSIEEGIKIVGDKHSLYGYDFDKIEFLSSL